MSTEARLQELADQLQNLLGCEAACLVLDCPDLALRHPLLDLFLSAASHLPVCFGTTALASLLDDEHVCAVCDLATQIGRVQSINQCHLCAGDTAVHSLAVVPVERRAGLLGFFLLANPGMGGFYQGEHHVLSDQQQTLAPVLERAVRDLCVSLLCARLHSTPGAVQGHGTARPARNGTTHSSRQKEAGHLQNEFVSIVSHELRVPLTAIKGYAGLLQAYSVADRLHGNSIAEMTPQRQQQYLDIIMEQANHLEVLVTDLLDISRIEAGRLVLRFTEVNVERLCQRVTRLAQQRIEQQQPGKYWIHCMVDAGLSAAWADPDRLEQVLTNLLENAAKYSPDGGVIEVLASTRSTPRALQAQVLPAPQMPPAIPATRGAHMMHITIRDQGIGISEQQRALLFRPFTRLEQPAANQVPGTGLGLYISRKLAEAMGGDIKLSSREGEGTSVTISLPLAQAGKSPVGETDFTVSAPLAEHLLV